MTRETVIGATPASFAISITVGWRGLAPARFGMSIFRGEGHGDSADFVRFGFKRQASAVGGKLDRALALLHQVGFGGARSLSWQFELDRGGFAFEFVEAENQRSIVLGLLHHGE